jgi:ribosome-associated protein
MDNEKKSRTQTKKEMLTLQKIGEKLCTLSEHQLQTIDLPQELQEAILFARSLNARKAKHRQMQYIGVLMRHIEVPPILRALEMIDQHNRLYAHQFQQIEKWRDDMINGNDEDIEHFLGTHPDTDRQYLRQLIRNCRKEKKSGKSSRSSRLLFRYLAEQIE